MKKLMIVLFVLAMAVGAYAYCIQPIRPIIPIKPVWCHGTWTQILECDPYCNCVWRAVCIQ